jgi:threonine synthase
VRYHSTEDKTVSSGFIEAVLNERLSDGGLYMPSSKTHSLVSWTPDFAEFAARLLLPFFEPDLGRAETLSLVRRAFTFPVQWRELSRRRYQLELFHGPTGASADFGAELFAQLVSTIPTNKQRLIILATNGESGPAIAAAFSKQPDIQVVILYPKSEVSMIDKQQMGCFGNNIKILAVDGSFEQCEVMISKCLKNSTVKEQFSVTQLSDTNLIWLLTQMLCCAYASLLSDRLHRQPLNLIIPVGNAGHLTAACLARAIGYPIGEIRAAQNANHPIVDYVRTGYIWNKENVVTLTPSIDVTKPANFPRLNELFPSWEEFSDSISAFCATDTEIKKAITACYQEKNEILSPHTALAYSGLPSIDADLNAWAIMGVTHPAKFGQVTQGIIGTTAPTTDRLEEQWKMPAYAMQVSAELDLLSDIVLDFCLPMEIAC